PAAGRHQPGQRRARRQRAAGGHGERGAAAARPRAAARRAAEARPSGCVAMSATMVLRVLRAAATRRPGARSGTALEMRRARSACAGRARRRAARRARAARRIRSAGLTLAELLIVLVILGMLAAVTTPALRRPGASAGRAAEELAGAFGAARAAAAARGDVVRVSIEPPAGAFPGAAAADG